MNLAALIWLAASLPAVVQAPATLEEQVVVRTRLPVGDATAFATTLDTTEIAARGEDLATVLRRVPGARVREYGGLGHFSTVSLRGSSPEQVTIMVDGVPQNRALGGPVDLSFIPATQLAEVTVYRGFAPAAAGLGGIGGMVDVRTRPPGPEPEGQVDLIAGELDTLRLSTGWSFRDQGRGRHRVGAEWLQNSGEFPYRDGGQTPFNPDDDVTALRVNNDVEMGSLLWQSVWEQVGAGELGFGLRAQRRDSGFPGVDSLPAEQTRLQDSLQTLDVTWRRQRDGVFQGVDLIADAFHQDLTFEDPAGEVPPGPRNTTTRLIGGGMAGTGRWQTARHRVLGRVDLRHEAAAVTESQLAEPDRGGARRHLAAATVEDLILLGKVMLAPSLRGEWRRDDFVAGGDGTLPAPAPDVEESLGSWKLGAAWSFSRPCALRGAVGTFFRSPSLLELFGDRGFVSGNPNLAAETGEAAELGFDCRGSASRSRWQLELVGFGRDVDDLIRFLPVTTATAMARNVGEARIRGLEGALSLAVPGGWSVNASGTLQSAENVTPGPEAGKPLVFQPATLGYLGVGWQRRRFTSRWDVTYVGENSSDPLDTPFLRLPERVIHDLFVSFRLIDAWTVGLDARNVMDTQTVDANRFPLPGRVLLLHVGWRTGGAGT